MDIIYTALLVIYHWRTTTHVYIATICSKRYHLEEYKHIVHTIIPQ